MFMDYKRKHYTLSLFPLDEKPLLKKCLLMQLVIHSHNDQISRVLLSVFTFMGLPRKAPRFVVLY